MIAIEEVALLSTEEAVAEVFVRLPAGWRFEREHYEGFYVGTLQNSDREVQWTSDPSPDLKIVALDACGWLHARDHKPQNPNWVRRRDTVGTLPVQGRMSLPGLNLPDPGDLDPEEISVIRNFKP